MTTHSQQGAALVVSLVMLLVLTVLAVSTMRTTSMEMRMAANDQFSENAFQLAETGLETNLAGLNSGAVPVPAATAPNTCQAPQAPVPVVMLGGTYQSTLCFTGDVPDFAGTGGSSLGKVRAYHFQNDTQGIAQGRASSFNSLGMRVLGPDAG